MSELFVYFSIISGLIMGSIVYFIRMKSTKKPMSIRKIVLPPIMMSTGALMYIYEPFRLSPLEILESIVLGLVFSVILIVTTKFEVRDDDIYLIQNKLFPIILVSLLVIRTVIKWLLSETFDPMTLAGMFFLVGFSMIVPWRISMYFKYIKLKDKRELNLKEKRERTQ